MMSSAEQFDQLISLAVQLWDEVWYSRPLAEHRSDDDFWHAALPCGLPNPKWPSAPDAIDRLEDEGYEWKGTEARPDSWGFSAFFKMYGNQSLVWRPDDSNPHDEACLVRLDKNVWPYRVDRYLAHVRLGNSGKLSLIDYPGCCATLFGGLNDSIPLVPGEAMGIGSATERLTSYRILTWFAYACSGRAPGDPMCAGSDGAFGWETFLNDFPELRGVVGCLIAAGHLISTSEGEYAVFDSDVIFHKLCGDNDRIYARLSEDELCAEIYDRGTSVFHGAQTSQSPDFLAYSLDHDGKSARPSGDTRTLDDLLPSRAGDGDCPLHDSRARCDHDKDDSQRYRHGEDYIAGRDC